MYSIAIKYNYVKNGKIALFDVNLYQCTSNKKCILTLLAFYNNICTFVSVCLRGGVFECMFVCVCGGYIVCMCALRVYLVFVCGLAGLLCVWGNI